MKATGLRAAVLLSVLLASASTVAAQKPQEDPRPLTGLDRSHIPTYASVEAYLQAQPPGNLLKHATPVGQALMSYRSVATPEGLRRTLEKAGRAPLGELVSAGGSLQVSRAENGTANWVTGHLGSASERLAVAGKNQAEAYVEASLDVLNAHRHALRLADPRGELRTMHVETDRLGYTHARFQQVYRGVPLWGRDLYVHFDVEGVAYALNGTYEPTPHGVNVAPELLPRQAFESVVTRLAEEGRWAPLPDDVMTRLDVEPPRTQLVVYPDADGARLAYEVVLHANLIERFTFIIDAETGAEINRIEMHCSLNHAQGAPPVIQVGSMGSSPASYVGGGANTFFDAEGVDLNGVNQSFRVYQNAEGLYFSILDLPNFSLERSVLPDQLEGGAVTLTANNTDWGENVSLFHVTSTDNVWLDPASVSATVNMRTAYEYYKDVHDRDAIDGKDQSIISILHVTQNGRAIDNAFWNGRVMIYGDGDQIFKPLAGALDVAGHEMTHGVVGNSAGLVYQFQSGALDESFADVFGVMVDREDFLLGEDIMLPGRGPALRDILNPANPQLEDPQPAHMNQYQNLTAQQDNGGVHINSGIPNRAAALIIQAIGHDKTERIYYRALTNYLTRNSQFGDARKAVIQSATDLYGAGGTEVAAAVQAFDAVGITDNTTGGGTEGNEPLPPLAGGQSLISFMIEDGSIGLLDMTNLNDLQVGLFQSPDATARANPEIGDFSQLTAPRSGERIWFINASGQLAVVDAASGEVSVFQQLYLNEPGDLWTASIDPDEGYVALVSAYANDPNLYFTSDGQTLAAIELIPESTQEGVYAQTIRYPDVVSWSPNPAYPRLAFDAYNEVPVGSSMFGFWSMYEIDFEAEKIYSLVPAQPANISVGNVTYSSNSPLLLAFNIIDEQGVWDVMLADFSSGNTAALGIPQITVEGVNVLDAQRPTFAPDDGMLAMVTPTYGVLLFFDGTNLTPLNLGAPVFNPNWFVLGGQSTVDTDASDELPERISLHGNYPNPFNPSTTIRLSLAAAADVRLDVYDLMGRHVRTVTEGAMAAGEHSVRFEADGLASGTYLVRLAAAGAVATHRMVLVR